jgi:23S rRNA (uracil1939-C5)-methyltransferase
MTEHPTPPERPPAGVRLAEVEELEVTVEKLVAGGDGLARFEGIPIFVPRSAPGDRLRVRLTDRRPDYGRAEIVEILAPGPERREAPCHHFTRCGGCDLQHIEDAAQVRHKAAAVLETLARLGGIEPPADLQVVAGAPWAYRLRTQLHTRGEGEAIEVGYHQRGSHELVAVEECPILVPELERLLADLPARLGAGAREGRPPRRLDLATGDGAEVTTAPVVEGLPHGPVDLTLDLPGGPITYQFDARCFFQAHRGLVAELAARAVGPWTGEDAFDLYAGVGLFSLPLARRYDRVTAIEADRIAARYARNNARTNKLPNLDLIAQSVDTWAANLPPGAARVLVDPPRGGLTLRLRAVLMERLPKRLTYVSCHPATLARDLRRLVGAYRLESLVLLDLFPQSGHMEAVAQLLCLAPREEARANLREAGLVSTRGESSVGPRRRETAVLLR